MIMKNFQRRSVMFTGFAAAAASTGLFPLPALADEDLFIPSKYENIKRGTIHSVDPSTRGLVVIWDDLGRVKMKASDLVVKSTSSGAGAVSNGYAELKPGQIVDVHWFDYLDFLVAKTSPEVTAHAKAMIAQGARIEGIPGSQHQVRLFSYAGLVTKTDPDYGVLYMINPTGGEPDAPAPASGEVIRVPQIKSEPGLAALRTIKQGDNVTTVFSVQTAIRIQIIR
jgi:hypothetical protein